MVKRKAEGDCSPQRCMTHICYWQLGTQRETHRQIQGLASLFFCYISSKNPAGHCGLQQREIKNNIWDNNTHGKSVSGQACHNPIILISHYHQCVCVRDHVDY